MMERNEMMATLSQEMDEMRNANKETKYYCENYSDKPSFCYPACGDKIIDIVPFNEECDDGNNFDYDGCSGSCKVEANYTCNLNAEGYNTCSLKYPSPRVVKSYIDLLEYQIIIEFDQIMLNQTITTLDMNLFISGLNNPYTEYWTSKFYINKLIISFECSPKLLGGFDESIEVQLINIQKFKNQYSIPLNSTKTFEFIVDKFQINKYIEKGGNSSAYAFILTLLLSFGIMIITGGSIELMWSFTNTIQILFYLSSLNLYYPQNLVFVFSLMKYSNFENPLFNYIQKYSLNVIGYLNPNRVSYFDNIGYSYTHVLLNSLGTIILIVLLITFAIINKILCFLLRKRDSIFANFVKRKDKDLCYEGITRFAVEISLNLIVTCLINILFCSYDSFISVFSLIISILLIECILYLLAYSILYSFYYYPEIITSPDIHERHCFLFLEFKIDKLCNLYFYSYFIIHRIAFGIIIVCMNFFTDQQLICIILVNFLFLFYTFRCYKRMLANFLHMFNCVVMMALSFLLLLFRSPKDFDKLEISGYVCISLILFFFVVNWIIAFPHLIFGSFMKLKNWLKQIKEKKNKKLNIIKEANELPSLIINDNAFNQKYKPKKLFEEEKTNKYKFEKYKIERIGIPKKSLKVQF